MNLHSWNIWKTTQTWPISRMGLSPSNLSLSSTILHSIPAKSTFISPPNLSLFRRPFSTLISQNNLSPLSRPIYLDTPAESILLSPLNPQQLYRLHTDLYILYHIIPIDQCIHLSPEPISNSLGSICVYPCII